MYAGFYFHHHDYYIMPFVPTLALLAAVGLERFPMRWAVAGLVVLVLEAGLNQQHDFRVPTSEQPKLGLAQLAQDHIPPEGHVVLVGDGNPIELYLLDRTGWVHSPLASFKASTYTQHGPTWLLVPSKHEGFFNGAGEVKHEDDHYTLIDLN